MKYSLFIMLFVSIFFLPCNSYAENSLNQDEKELSDKDLEDEEESSELDEDVEQIMVTATRTETPVSQLPDSVTIITEEQIKQQKARTVFETLRSVPGLNVRKSGGIGRLTNVTIRGSASNQVLVMIDGVQVNSPTTGDFNFANLTTDNLERIEIVRGPQSTLYGSDAMAGLVNIVTKKGKGKPKFGGRFEFGTPEKTFNEAINSSGSLKSFNYSFDVARTDSDGRGSDDDYEKTNVSARVGYKIIENLNFDTSLRYNDSKVGIDDGPFVNDPNRTSENEDFVINSTLTHNITDWWSQRLKFSFADSDLKSTDHPNPGVPDPFGTSRFHMDTQIYTGEWQQTLNYKDINTFVVGFEFEDQEADNRSFDESIVNRGWYFQNQLKLWDRFFFNAGLRIDDNNRYGKEYNPKLSMAYHLKETDTKFKANWGKGFRGPTLNDLFWPGAGNPTLEPEESESYDIGIEQYLFEDKVFFGATYFKNRFSNLIQWAPIDSSGLIWRPQNISSVRTEGVELEAVVKPFKGLTMRGTFTRTSTRDAHHKELIRQPRTQGSFNINYNFLEKFNINIDDTIVSHSRAGFNSRGIRINDGFNKLDFAFTYNHSKYLKLYTRIENVLNEKFDEILGFRSPGTRFFFGFELNM